MKRQKAKQVRTLRDLAAALGCAVSTAHSYVEHEGWPVARKGPWSAQDLAAIAAWRKGLQENRAAEAAAEAAGEGQALASPAEAAELKMVGKLLKREQMRLTRVRREQLEGILVEKAILEKALVALAQCFVQQLEEMLAALPLQLAGMTPGQLEKALKERFNACRTRLAERRTLELQLVEENIKAQQKAHGRGRRKARVS